MSIDLNKVIVRFPPVEKVLRRVKSLGLSISNHCSPFQLGRSRCTVPSFVSAYSVRCWIDHLKQACIQQWQVTVIPLLPPQLQWHSYVTVQMLLYLHVLILQLTWSQWQWQSCKTREKTGEKCEWQQNYQAVKRSFSNRGLDVPEVQVNSLHLSPQLKDVSVAVLGAGPGSHIC